MKPGEVYYSITNDLYRLFMILKSAASPYYQAVLVDSESYADQIGTYDFVKYPVAAYVYRLGCDESVVERQKCICETRDLCNFGCKCGGI